MQGRAESRAGSVLAVPLGGTERRARAPSNPRYKGREERTLVANTYHHRAQL